MGSVGKGKQQTYYDFSDNDVLSGKTKYSGDQASEWWEKNKDFSNAGDWKKGLSDSEKNAILNWSAFGYATAAELYDTEWDDISEAKKEFMSNLYNAINKFETKQGITVNRATNFMVFGQNGHTSMTAEEVKDWLGKNGNVLQSDGFMSFSTNPNGESVGGSGLVIHLNVPPNKGLGAYISHVAMNHSEREYLLNNNAVMKFDPNSVWQGKTKNGYDVVHVNAELLGRAKMQTIDSKNKSSKK